MVHSKIPKKRTFANRLARTVDTMIDVKGQKHNEWRKKYRK
jgi:hypothetical protein